MASYHDLRKKMQTVKLLNIFFHAYNLLISKITRNVNMENEAKYYFIAFKYLVILFNIMELFFGFPLQ